MKKYKITDKQRKMLTEFIGECWHEYDCEMEDDGIIRQFCVICDADSSSNHFGFRTFTTDSDMMAVRKALRNKEEMEHALWLEERRKGIGGTVTQLGSVLFVVMRQTIIQIRKVSQRISLFVLNVLKRQRSL